MTYDYEVKIKGLENVDLATTKEGAENLLACFGATPQEKKLPPNVKGKRGVVYSNDCVEVRKKSVRKKR